MSIDKARLDFPQMNEEYNGVKINYLDSAATTLKPKSVIDVLDQYYLHECANIHRGIHTLSEVGTEKFENTRDKVQKLINANKREEIIFTKGTTDSINLVAQSLSEYYFKQGDEIIISTMEHHSNIVPWQRVCEKTGAILKIIPINDEGEILIDEYKKLLSSKTKLVSTVYISNSLGTINPVKEITDLAHSVGARVLIDAAQAIAHETVDVQSLECDYLAFSGHKMFGPTGVGVLYGKEEILNEMPPYQGGGDMIETVTFEKTTYNVLPHKFEAGTPHIAGVIALGAAIDYLNELGLENIKKYEAELLNYATEQVLTVPGLKIIGTAKKKASVISFTINGLHPHDIATIGNKYGLALRTGHHCTQPLLKRLGVPATARASLSIYNNKEDIDNLVTNLKKMVELFT
jgi:cysteine desulfurase/selenocysteine lyase